MQQKTINVYTSIKEGYLGLILIVVGVMKMGNTVPRVGLEPTSLAFWASVLPLHHVGFPDFTTIPTPTCLCSSLPQGNADYYIHPPGI